MEVKSSCWTQKKKLKNCQPSGSIQRQFQLIGLLLLLCNLSLIQIDTFGQQYTSIRVKSKYQSYRDSLKNIDYHYQFPLLGAKAYKRGFDLPNPVGIMGNFLWMKQSILIDNLQLGLSSDNHEIPMTEVDFIQFGDNINTSYTVNVRPDLWIFPFLNVYGIFGYGSSTTEVNIVNPVELKSIVEQNISTAGLGIMTAFGIGPVWMSVDANWTWNKPELLDKAVNVNVLGVRLGHTFIFKHRPDRNIAIWAGGMRANLSSSTQGAVRLGDALPPETWERRDEIVTNYQDWYENLNPNNPVDRVKIEAADRVLTPIVNRIAEADGNAVIKYGMEKQVKEKWNGVVGMQYQMNKKWMLRGEAGLIGDRKSILASINYRFLI